MNYIITLGFSSAEQRRGFSKPDCSFHSGPCAKDGPVRNGRLGRRSTLICPERLKDFGAEEYLNGDVKVFESSISKAPEVELVTQTPKPVKKRRARLQPNLLRSICASRTSAPPPSNSSRPAFRNTLHGTHTLLYSHSPLSHTHTPQTHTHAHTQTTHTHTTHTQHHTHPHSYTTLTHTLILTLYTHTHSHTTHTHTHTHTRWFDSP